MQEEDQVTYVPNKADKKKIEGILFVLMIAFMLGICIVALKISNDYNELVIECNELRANQSDNIWQDLEGIATRRDRIGQEIKTGWSD